MSDIEIPSEDENSQELVHWFDRRPVQLTPVQVSAAVAGGFILGALTAIGALAIAGRLRN